MRLLVILMVGFACPDAAECASSALVPHRVEPRPNTTCGCEFFRPAEGGGLGFDPLVAIGINEQPPFAVVNLGDGNQTLSLVKDSGWRACRAGEKWESRWQGRDLVLDVSLLATGPGEESCWFDGSLSMTRGNAKASLPIRGACGC